MARDLFGEILRLREEGVGAALATLVDVKGSSPAAVGSKLLLTLDRMVAGTVGGGCLEADVFAEAKDVIRTETPRLVEFTLTETHSETGLVCGGTVAVFIEPLVHPILFVFGGGHVGAAIAEAATLAGFQVWVLDDREAFANRERHPEAVRTLVVDFADVGAAGLPVSDNSYVAIVTRGHEHDRDVLRWATRTPARYVGMIGSRRKILMNYESLVAEGVSPRAFDRVRAPIGLDVSAVTAAEIGIAVAAELIEERRRHRARKKGERRPKLEDEISIGTGRTKEIGS